MNENNPKEVSSVLDHSNELSVEDVIRETSRNLSTAAARINVRRGRLLNDYIETRTKFPWFKTNGQIKVTFMGEPAIDAGGPKREFLSDVLEEVRGRLFPDGEPVCSAQAVCNLSFTYAGELMAMAIVHGGPAPSLLKRWVYDYLASGVNSVNPSVEDLNSSQLKSFISQLINCTDSKAVQDTLTSEIGLEVLQEIGFRGIPTRSYLQTRDEVVRFGSV